MSLRLFYSSVCEECLVQQDGLIPVGLVRKLDWCAACITCMTAAASLTGWGQRHRQAGESATDRLGRAPPTGWGERHRQAGDSATERLGRAPPTGCGERHRQAVESATDRLGRAPPTGWGERHRQAGDSTTDTLVPGPASWWPLKAAAVWGTVHACVHPRAVKIPRARAREFQSGFSK